MKRCPNCHRSYTDDALNFCLEDGTPLVSEAASLENNETRRYVAPPTEVYRPAAPSYPQPPMVNRAPAFQGQYSPMPPPAPRKSNAVWWILGGIAVLAVIGVGVVVILLAIASINSQSNNRNAVVNVNAKSLHELQSSGQQQSAR